MTKTQKLAQFMEAVSIQSNLDELKSKRNNFWTKYLTAKTSKEWSKFLNAWLNICSVIEQTQSDLFLILK